MLNLDQLTPEQYRERYEMLQAKARERAASLDASLVTHEPPEIPPGAIIAAEEIPAGGYIGCKVRRGEALHVVTETASAGASLMLWNAEETSERFNPGDTVKLQWTTKLSAGRVLFSDMGRVLASITADSGAGHDALLGPSTPASAGAARNGRDNLRAAAAKFGLNRRDLGPSLTLFAHIRPDAEGRFQWREMAPAGSFVTLRAEMNLLVALSNTPCPRAPGANAGPLGVVHYRAPPPPPDDLCRHSTEEAERGFENTVSLFAEMMS